jgi:hypothetical protein
MSLYFVGRNTKLTMLSLEDVFAKFGVTAEAGQLLETQLGNLLLSDAVNLHGFDKVQNKVLARKILEEIDRKTLGQLIHELRKRRTVPPEFEKELEVALSERNRLNHSFYREHNIRKNSEHGRQLMLADLEVIHERIFQAYLSASSLSDIEVASEALAQAQTGHLPLKARE